MLDRDYISQMYDGSDRRTARAIDQFPNDYSLRSPYVHLPTVSYRPVVAKAPMTCHKSGAGATEACSRELNHNC